VHVILDMPPVYSPCLQQLSCKNKQLQIHADRHCPPKSLVAGTMQDAAK
jgi:hypothetical protein